MHTSKHTNDKQTPYLMVRNGSYYFNRRVPKHAVDAFGGFIRVRLSRNRADAEKIAENLSGRLEVLWENESLTVGVDLDALVQASKPKRESLLEWLQEYVQLRGLNPTPPRVAVEALLRVVGDKDIRDLNREDARALTSYLLNKGCKSATVRRRLGSVSAIVSHAYAELKIDRRNPFSRVLIQGEGDDAKKRGVFSEEELRQGYREAFQSGNPIWLLMPLLGETGCRLGEIVGLRVEDVDLEKRSIRLTPHSARRLKSSGSEREIPLVGQAFDAMRLVVDQRQDGYLYDRYLRGGEIKCTHASNTISKWLKRRFDGKTAHCLRHTFRDRMRAVECPLEMIDALGGWSSIGTVGVRYRKGFDLEHKRRWLDKIVLKLD